MPNFMPNVETRSIPLQPAGNVISMTKKIVIGIVKVVLYVAFVAAAIYYTPKILSKELNTPYPLATITSGSMWPVLKTNDLILMKGITAAQAQIGQIIVYKTAQGFTIHRLIRIDNGQLITKGDANDVEDVPVMPSQVIGRAVYVGSQPFRIPYLGLIARNLVENSGIGEKRLTI